MPHLTHDIGRRHHRAHLQVSRDASGILRPIADLETGIEVKAAGARGHVRHAVGAVVKLVAVGRMRVGTVSEGAFASARFIVVSASRRRLSGGRRRGATAIASVWDDVIGIVSLSFSLSQKPLFL